MEASPLQGLQRRKSLSGMFGTISQKVTPKRGSIFRRKSQSYPDNSENAKDNKDPENSLDLAKSQAVLSALENPPQLSPRPSLNSRGTHISFVDQLAGVYDDLKDKHLGTRQSSIGSATTLFGQAPMLPDEPVPNEMLSSLEPNEVRASTPDSYLQALVESHCPEIMSPTTAQDVAEVSDPHTEALIESGRPEKVSPVSGEDGRGTPDSYLQGLIDSQSPESYTLNLAEDERRDCASVSPSKCRPVEPVDFIDNFFNERTVSGR